MVLTEQERKERKAIVDKKYYLNNKEKVAENGKQYRNNNKEKIAEYIKQYYLNNKEKVAEQNKQYFLDNPKIFIISHWKRQGVIDDDFDSLYEYFITQTNCWICNKVYNNDNVMDRRCLDHDHDLLDEPNIRYICCNYCNLHIVK
jgi:hypothetical protein